MRIVLVSLLIMLFSGCAAMQPVGKDLSREQVYHKIQPGDELIIELKSQEKVKIIRTSVRSNGTCTKT